MKYRHRSIFNMTIPRKRDVYVFLAGIGLGLIIGLKFINCPLPFTIKGGYKTSSYSAFDPNGSTDDESLRDGSQFKGKQLFVGLMTTKDNLGTRALAASKTWVPSVKGDVSFFCGMSCNGSLSSDMPIRLTLLPLSVKEDTYPPQKKSFMMLKYMYENHLHDYEWFLRGDDDVYVNSKRLSAFLASLNSSKAHFIGHPGYGKKHEVGKLGLVKDRPYCMGGPGMVLSRRTLELLGPHLDHCMENLYSSHEDTEIGRCVHKFVKIFCVEDEQYDVLFRNMYKWGTDLVDPARYKAVIRQALTIHPLKNHHSVYAVYDYINGEKTRRTKKQVILRKMEITQADNLIRNATLSRSKRSQFAGILNARHPEEIWIGINSTRYFSHQMVNPAFSSVTHKLYLEHKQVSLLVSYMNKLGRKFKYKLSKANALRNLRYGYFKLYPNKAATYILSVHGKKGKKWQKKQYILKHKLSNLGCSEEMLDTKRVNVIVPISGRQAILNKFLNSWEKEISKYGENVSLTFVVMEGKRNQGQFKKVVESVKEIRKKFPSQPIHVLKMKHFFQRAKALQKGADFFENHSLLFFLDIDCLISRNTLHEIRTNTIRSKQVYFPVVFSHYNPKYEQYNNISKYVDHDNTYSYSNGYWRIGGFGMFSIYKSDFTFVGGFNTNIKGWGSEDVDILERIIARKLTIFRGPSLGLVHLFHKKICYEKLSRSQAISCEKVKWETDASLEVLTKIAAGKLPEVFERRSGNATSEPEYACPRFCTELRSMKINRAEPICTQYC